MAFRERLSQKEFAVPRRAVPQGGEDGIAQLFVERPGLEAERRQLHMEASTLAGLGLGGQQRLAPIALPTDRLSEPEDRDVQPLPPDMPEHAPQHGVVRIFKEDRQQVVVSETRDRHVIQAQPALDELLEVIRRMGLYHDPQGRHRGLSSAAYTRSLVHFHRGLCAMGSPMVCLDHATTSLGPNLDRG
jgi:hypothetical protein